MDCSEKLARSIIETIEVFSQFGELFAKLPDDIETAYARTCPVCNNELVVKESRYMEDLKESDLLSIEGMRLVAMTKGIMYKYEISYDAWRFIIHRHGVGYRVSWYVDDKEKGLTLIDRLTTPDINGVVGLLREALCNINKGSGSDYELRFKK